MAIGTQVGIDLGEDVGAKAVDKGKLHTSAEVPVRIEFFGSEAVCARGQECSTRE